MAKGSGGGSGRSGGRIRVGDTVEPRGQPQFRSTVLSKTRGGFLVRSVRAKPGQIAFQPTFLPSGQAVRVG